MTRLTMILMLMALAACGRGAEGIGQAASEQLTPQVQQIRAAATSGDAAMTAAKLAELRRTVAELRQRGDLSDAGAAKVLAAAAEVERGTGVGGVPPPASQTSPPSLGPRTPSTPAPAPSTTGEARPAPAEDDDGDKGRGKGEGKGEKD